MFGFFGESSRQQGAFNTNMSGPEHFGDYVYAHQGACPYCGLNLWTQHPAYNIYPHIMATCTNTGDPVSTAVAQKDEDFLRQMGIKP